MVRREAPGALLALRHDRLAAASEPRPAGTRAAAYDNYTVICVLDKRRKDKYVETTQHIDKRNNIIQVPRYAQALLGDGGVDETAGTT